MLETVRAISGDETPLWFLGLAAAAMFLLWGVVRWVNRWIDRPLTPTEMQQADVMGRLDREDYRTSDERWAEFDRTQGRPSQAEFEEYDRAAREADRG